MHGGYEEKENYNKAKKIFYVKSFISKSKLVAHESIHTGEKPYECVICGGKVRENTALVKHMRTLTGVKPYECDICKLFCCSQGPAIRCDLDIIF